MADDNNVGAVSGAVMVRDNQPTWAGMISGAILMPAPQFSYASRISLAVLVDEYPTPPPPEETGAMLSVNRF